jgi:hypothetical protein
MYITKATARRLVNYAVRSVEHREIKETVGKDIKNHFGFHVDDYTYKYLRISFFEWKRSEVYIAVYMQGKYILQKPCSTFKELKEAIKIIKNTIESEWTR